MEDINIIILGVILIFAMFSFIFEWMQIEVTALAVAGLILLVDVIADVGGYPSFLLAEHEDIFKGFSNSAVIAIGAMFILSRALVRTGFLVVFADMMYKWAGRWRWMSISLFLIVVSLLSGLINNTAVVAIFIPFVIDICQRYHISPSKLLLPLSYAAIFGGTLTLIGTSTNLLVNSIIENTPGKEHLVFGMFEFTKLGLIFLAVGTLYNIVVAKWLIPSRAIVSSLTQKYQISKYVTEYKVDEKSSLIGEAFKNIKNDIDYSAGIMKILRSGVSIKIQNLQQLKRMMC